MDPKVRSRRLWDCESSLYDSFELESFVRRLESAIDSRSLSMSRLSEPSDHQVARPRRKRRMENVLRSAKRWVRWVLRLKSPPVIENGEDGRYVLYSRLAVAPDDRAKSTRLRSGPFDSTVRKTKSERISGSGVRVKFMD